MSRARIEVPQLENMVGAGKKKFVRYAEGASLYSLGLHTFQEIAKKANDSVEGYLDSLEKELKDKKAQLENYTRAIASINEIEKIL